MKGSEESFMPLTEAARKRYAAYKKTGRTFKEPPLMALVTWYNDHGRTLHAAPRELIADGLSFIGDRIALLSTKTKQPTLRRCQLKWLARWKMLADAEILRQTGVA